MTENCPTCEDVRAANGLLRVKVGLLAGEVKDGKERFQIMLDQAERHNNAKREAASIAQEAISFHNAADGPANDTTELFVALKEIMVALGFEYRFGVSKGDLKLLSEEKGKL